MTKTSKDTPLRLEYRTASELADHPRNWRVHGTLQKDALKAQMEQVGWAGACLYNEQTGHLIDGHLRKEQSGDDLVPVLIGSWTEEQENLLLITLDPISSLADTNKDSLGKLLHDFQTDDDALKAMIESLANQNGIDLFSDGNEGGLTDPDSIPAPPDDPITKPGDLWCLGDHRLYCGDSSKPEDVDRLLGGESIQLVNTDPPYNVMVEPRSNNAIAVGNSSFPNNRKQQFVTAGLRKNQHFDLARRGGKTGKMRAKDRILSNDMMSPEAFDLMLAAWFGNLARVLDPGRGFYIWGGYANLINYPPALKTANLYFSQGIIWVKDWPVINRHDFMCNFEIAYYGWKPGAAHYFTPDIKNARDTWEITRHKGKNQDPKAIDASSGVILTLGKGHDIHITGKIPDKTRRVEMADEPVVLLTYPGDVWRVRKINPMAMVHLTEKPVELALRAMKYSSRPGENVLDLFGGSGSGSTLIAAEMAGRKAFLMELDPPYCDVIVERWEKFTGRKAKLAPKPKATNGQAKATRRTQAVRA
jgi:DNA modification methylase